MHVDGWVRRGRDYLQLITVATVDAADVAGVLDLAWQSFREAAAMTLPGGYGQRHGRGPPRH